MDLSSAGWSGVHDSASKQDVVRERPGALHLASSVAPAERPAIASILEHAAGCREEAEAPDSCTPWWTMNFDFRWFSYSRTHDSRAQSAPFLHNDDASLVFFSMDDESEAHHPPCAPSGLNAFDEAQFGWKVPLSVNHLLLKFVLPPRSVI